MPRILAIFHEPNIGSPRYLPTENGANIAPNRQNRTKFADFVRFALPTIIIEVRTSSLRLSSKPEKGDGTRKPRRERSKKRMRVMNLWSWSDVSKAVPYLHSIVGSLREHWLDLVSVQNKIDKAAAEKGLPKRQQLIEAKTHQ